MDVTLNTVREYRADRPFSLPLTAAPVAWGRGRWPNADWIDGALVWVGWEDNAISARVVCQEETGAPVTISGESDPARDLEWLNGVLGFSKAMPAFTVPVIAGLAIEMPGLRPFANASLFDGVIGSIVGQSISVASAATTERRLASLVHPGIVIGDRTYFPSPRGCDLAGLSAEEVRPTGVTWRRAEAIVAISQIHESGAFPVTPDEDGDIQSTRSRLREFPLVGPWTAESALLWGVGMPDIYPSGDVALLRAARRAYDLPEMSMKEMDELSQTWKPGRSWAARLLWTDLLGSAPRAGSSGSGPAS